MSSVLWFIRVDSIHKEGDEPFFKTYATIASDHYVFIADVCKSLAHGTDCRVNMSFQFYAKSQLWTPYKNKINDVISTQLSLNLMF